MRRYLNRCAFVLFPFAISYAVAYLIGAFVSASWNLAEWTESWRMVDALIGNVYGYALYVRLEWEFK